MRIPLLILGALALLLTTAPAHAAQTADGCRAAKIKVTASLAAAQLKCHATAATKGEAVDPDCLNKAVTKFGVGFTRIESRGSCSPAGDDADYLAKAQDFVAEIVSGNLCPAKLKASGSEGQALLKCYSKGIKKGVAVDDDCLTKAEARFESSFTKADSKGCTPTGGSATVQAQVDSFVTAVSGAAPVASQITIFSAGPTANGILGNRATTSGLCSSAAATQMLTCNTVVSLLSYSGDQVSDFPTRYALPTTIPLIGGGKTFATNWADFLDGSWSTCPGPTCAPSNAAGANLIPDTTGGWSGTNSDGTLGNNCNDWTATSDNANGINPLCSGESDFFNGCSAGGTLYGKPTSCTSPSQYLLCLCY